VAWGAAVSGHGSGCADRMTAGALV
jgi:hypothetical protein